MKILLLGKNGQVGWKLQRSLALMVDVLAQAIRRSLNTQNLSPDGVYHLVALGETNWRGYVSLCRGCDRWCLSPLGR